MPFPKVGCTPWCRIPTIYANGSNGWGLPFPLLPFLLRQATFLQHPFPQSSLPSLTPNSTSPLSTNQDIFSHPTFPRPGYSSSPKSSSCYPGHIVDINGINPSLRPLIPSKEEQSFHSYYRPGDTHMFMGIHIHDVGQDSSIQFTSPVSLLEYLP